MALVIPALHVTDIDRACAYYRDSLGFEVDWVWRPDPGAAAFAQVSRDGLRIYLNEESGPEGRGCVYLYVDDVDRWHRELLSRSVAVDHLPCDRLWGNREMQLSDPDGNRLRFCTPIG